MSNADIQHFRTTEDFDTYVDSLGSAPSWFSAVLTHHTLIPTVAQWRGLPTMLGMLSYYEDLGWNRFPHVYVAPDGIWTMNKLRERGTHSNAANPFGIAVEVVGNYDTIIWQEPIRTYAIETHLILMDWGKISPDRVLPHRLYNPTKSCPGKAIDMIWLRKELIKAKQDRENKTYKIIVDVANIRQGPSKQYPIAGKLPRESTFVSSVRKIDENDEYIGGKNTWRHILRGELNGNPIGGLGFVHESLLEEI